MINTVDLTQCLIISIIYLLILPFQLVIFPMNYYSVREVIYSKSFKKAAAALVGRFVFIFLLCLICWLLRLKDSISIYGITIGSFLCTWPSIYHYQLFIFWKNKSKCLYFCSCVVSVLFSFVSAKLSMNLFMPLLFEGASSFFIDNSAFSFLISLLEFCAPFGIRKLLDKEGQENPYIDSDTFMADLCLTRRKIQFEKGFKDQYYYEILKSAQKYGIGMELLTTVLQLERINRGSMHGQLIESILVKRFGNILIKKNATLGLAQISIQMAKDYFQKAPERYLPEMLKPEISIDLCAYMIRKLLDEYQKNGFDLECFEDYEDIYFDLDDNMKLSLYIASEYTCGYNLSLRKFAMVYATIIQDARPIHYISENVGNG